MQNCFSVEFSWFYPKIQKNWCCSDSHQELQFVLYTNLHFCPCWRFSSREKVPGISQLWFFMVQMDTSCGNGTSCPFSSEILSELFLASQEPHSPRFSWCPWDLLAVHSPAQPAHGFTPVLPIGRAMGATPAPVQMQQGNLGWVNLLPAHTQVHFAI